MEKREKKNPTEMKDQKNPKTSTKKQTKSSHKKRNCFCCCDSAAPSGNTEGAQKIKEMELLKIEIKAQIRSGGDSQRARQEKCRGRKIWPGNSQNSEILMYLYQFQRKAAAKNSSEGLRG